MKKVYIIHGWSGSPEEPLHRWLASELEKNGFEVEVPSMPNPDYPKIEDWVSKLKEAVGDTPDENIIFVGHSIGCQTIMRYLETFNEVKIGGALFVAGWFNLKNLEDKEVEKIAEPWLKTPINLEKVKKSIGQLRVILSDDDPYNYIEKNSKTFEEKLGVKPFIEENADHFTGGKHPRILTELLRLLKVVNLASRIE